MLALNFRKNKKMNSLKTKTFSLIIAVCSFLVLSVVYMYPALEGKNIKQQDIVQFKGGAQELIDYRNTTGEEAIWTNSMFSGMPGFLISVRYTKNVLTKLHRALVLNNWRPVCFLFLYLMGFYLSLLAFGVNQWLSIIGAIAYAFSSYFLIIIEVGHATKSLALGYLPPIIGGMYLAFKGKYIWGALMTGIALGLQILVNHLQMTYYTLIIVAIFGISEFIIAIVRHKLKEYFKGVAILSVAVILALGSNFASLWSTYEYGKFSIRGPSELTYTDNTKTSGLDIDYATQWSYGVGESFTLLVPNFKGGASISELPESSETYEFLVKAQGRGQAKKTIKQMPTYFGKQPGTSGPVYVGAIIVFLFVLGVLFVDNRYRCWLIAATFVSLIFAWGKNIPGITHFLFNHLPMYNKFRAVSSALVIAEFTIPLLAILALDRILKGDINKKEVIKKVKIALGTVGGLLLIFLLFGKGLFDFQSTQDEHYLAQGATQFVDALQSDRAMLLRKDSIRSLVFILMASGTILLYINKKLKLNYFLLSIGFIILIDMWGVARRYLNEDNFVPKRKYENPISETVADKSILKDKDPNYRVLNLAVSPFNDATTSYYHKSIGGYHGAKLRRYQELIDHRISKDMQLMGSVLQSKGIGAADNAFMNTYTLNMLNMKYLIYNPQAPAIKNPHALGNAWFVKNYQIVDNADEEIETLGKINTADNAVIDKRYSAFVNGKKFYPDSTASIQLVEYKPNYLKYKSNTSSEQLAVFSEIYYPKGWNVFIDGKPVEYFRADYVLRAMVIPTGNHEIEFRFESRSYIVGQNISLASSLLFILLMVGAIAYEARSLIQRKQ